MKSVIFSALFAMAFAMIASTSFAGGYTPVYCLAHDSQDNGFVGQSNNYKSAGLYALAYCNSATRVGGCHLNGACKAAQGDAESRAAKYVWVSNPQEAGAGAACKRAELGSPKDAMKRVVYICKNAQ